ncbi:MAG: 4Fe-4S dicluster domain-containing protein [Nitrospirae bacterium]|nr:4Fe-4S dicluster domain-containing protein [Nitrospirota bacterium]
MSVRGYIRPERLWQMVDRLSTAGLRVVAPTTVDGLCQFGVVTAANQVVTDYLLPQNTFKEFLFPKQEQVFTYLRNGDGSYLLTEPRRAFPETVVLGARPCDTVGIMGSLAAVFGGDKWGYEDPLFTERRRVTTVVSFSCDRPDISCFCTTQGLGPDDPKGSDVLITRTEGDAPVCVVEVFSARGEALLDHLGDLVAADRDASGLALARKQAGALARERFVRVFDISQVKTFLDNPGNFDDEMFERLGTKCVSCGVCTFECPTCHCFDFQDVGAPGSGERIKIWDSCQLPDFTLHASGHQPRKTSWERYRNRFLCKFKIYEDAFEALGCTGCGRCVRDCPVHVDITSYAMQANKKQQLVQIGA